MGIYGTNITYVQLSINVDMYVETATRYVNVLRPT
jgi:hypothetical protein